MAEAESQHLSARVTANEHRQRMQWTLRGSRCLASQPRQSHQMSMKKAAPQDLNLHSKAAQDQQPDQHHCCCCCCALFVDTLMGQFYFHL